MSDTPSGSKTSTSQNDTKIEASKSSTTQSTQKTQKSKKQQQSTSSTDQTVALTDTTNKKSQQRRRKPKAKASDTDRTNNSNSGESSSSKKQRPPRFNKQRPQGQLTKEVETTAIPSSSKDDTGTNNGGTNKSGNTTKTTGTNNDGTNKSGNTTKKQHRRGNRNKKKPTSSSIPPPESDDMASTMAYELSTSTYECMVCWDVVRPSHPIWTCDKCWGIYHTNCIEKWASKSLKDTSTNMMITSWRCPGCQHKRTAIPQGYFCFCGKQQNPNPKHYQTPHTCDNLCKRARKCPHPCVLPCHPGPCPPCTSMGPTNVCFCGKERRQARCVDTDYDTNAYSCGNICGQLLGCGKHRCEQECHSGLCQPCMNEEEHQECYCGQSERNIRCGSGLAAFSIDGRVGYYACEKPCTSTYDCGVHRCGKQCHPCTTLKTCPYDPSLITTCPCGSSTIESLLDGASRKKCTDTIPTCGGICHKLLPCGHSCQQRCHRGDCGPCEEQVKIPCRCQSSEYDAICSTVSDHNRPTCGKICKSYRNCGRHVCGNTCCPANKIKGKKRNQGSEKAHDCPLQCGRLLSCGKHSCQEKCHKGPCRPCLEAVFDDVTCHCGRTRLEAPVRCGTQLPHCPHPCLRPSPCGHIRLLHHNCHPDDEPCPPCPVLISRECLCGKAQLKNIPCYREAAHCGIVCDKLLPCGEHRCQRTCHDGDCCIDGQECTQPCRQMRTSCGHPCLIPCHGDTPCPETIPCSTRIRAKCACGQNTMEIPCNSSATSSGSNPNLECNDFCAKILRNRKLASALDIQRDDYSGQLGTNASEATINSGQPLSADDLGYYDESLRGFYMENANWCKQMERQLIAFVKDEEQTSLHFKPMRSPFRRFLHRYSVHFNIATEAMDPEPFRSVALRKTLGQCRLPPSLLSQAIRDPKLMAPPPPPTMDSSTPKQVRSSKPPVNALTLSGLQFGILQEDLDLILKPILNSDTITYTTQWGKEATDVVVIPNLDHISDMEEKESLIWHWKKGLQSAFLFNDVAGEVQCCWINRSGEITWSETARKIVLEEDIKGKRALEQAQHNRFDILGDHPIDPSSHDNKLDDSKLDDTNKLDDDWEKIVEEDIVSDRLI